MKKIITPILCALLFVLCFSSVEAQQPTKIPRIGIVTAQPYLRSQSVMTPSDKVCGSLAIWKGKTLSLNIDLQRGNLIECLRSWPR